VLTPSHYKILDTETNNEIGLPLPLDAQQENLDRLNASARAAGEQTYRSYHIRKNNNGRYTIHAIDGTQVKKQSFHSRESAQAVIDNWFASVPNAGERDGGAS
jgi:hypothetical protein